MSPVLAVLWEAEPQLIALRMDLLLKHGASPDVAEEMLVRTSSLVSNRQQKKHNPFVLIAWHCSLSG